VGKGAEDGAVDVASAISLPDESEKTIRKPGKKESESEVVLEL
jgi:hypothetical protein